jgi:hypothetical protein
MRFVDRKEELAALNEAYSARYCNKHWKSCEEAHDVEKKYVRRKQHTVSFNGGSFD